MARLLLFLGKKIGRFAILAIALPSFGLTLLWVAAFDIADRQPLIVLFFAPIAIGATMFGLVLVVGMIFAGIRWEEADTLSREDVAELWSIWRELTGDRVASRTTLCIDADLNAGVGLSGTFASLFSRRYVLTIGLPLLATMDHEAIKAVLAHEYAHLRNRDVNGKLGLFEMEKCFEAVFDYAPPRQSVFGSVLYLLLTPITDALAKEEQRLSWSAEFASDRHAAEVGHAAGVARALILLNAAVELYERKVEEPLAKELLGAMSPPRPPLARFLDLASELTRRRELAEYARLALEKPIDSTSDHPPFGERLAALGYSSMPEVEPITLSGLSMITDQKKLADLIREFDDAWTTMVADALER